MMFPRNLLLLLLPLLASAGCSLIINVDECDVDTDCSGLGAYCEAHVCAPARPCTNSLCATIRGPGFVCGRQGQCVASTNEHCTRVIGPTDRDNIVIVGSVMPTTDRWASLGRPIEQGMELAVREVNETGGITGGRPLALIQCDDAGNEAQAISVSQYLANEVGVPVIFGPAFSSNFIQVTTRVAVPAGVMMISPSATSPLITTLEDQGLGWRTAASDAFQAVALIDLIRSRGYQKLIVLGKNDAYGNGLLAPVTNAIASALGDSLYSRTYPDPSNEPHPDFSPVVTNALTAIPAPDAVVILGTTESIQIMQLFERALGASTATTTHYVFADGGRLDDMLSAVNGSPRLLNRVEGTEPDHQSGPLFRAFSLRFQQQFGMVPGIYGANAYDAVYLAAYGISTLSSDERPSGARVAAGMAKLVTGDPIDAGPNGVGLARRILGSGGPINYNGASGPLDFDLSTGEAPANVALWQVERRADSTLRFKTAGHYSINAGGTGAWTF